MGFKKGVAAQVRCGALLTGRGPVVVFFRLRTPLRCPGCCTDRDSGTNDKGTNALRQCAATHWAAAFRRLRVLSQATPCSAVHRRYARQYVAEYRATMGARTA